MAIANSNASAEPDPSMMTLEILDEFEAELQQHPGLPQGLVWKIVTRLAATETDTP